MCTDKISERYVLFSFVCSSMCALSHTHTQKIVKSIGRLYVVDWVTCFEKGEGNIKKLYYVVSYCSLYFV